MQPHRLRQHTEYQRVYQAGRKQFAKNIAYFFALRGDALRNSAPCNSPALPPEPSALRCATSGPRIGLTVPKALGNAVLRNRIKRRLREAVRHALPLLTAPVDLVLHPRRVVLEMEFAQLEREVAALFRAVQAACDRPSSQPGPTPQRAPQKRTASPSRPAPQQRPAAQQRSAPQHRAPAPPEAPPS